jgi:UDP-N-acetylglucosamine transferase subunit ALG13
VTALVLALAGTDHHPFDRLVTWMDAAATRHQEVRFLVQHGSSSRPPVVAEGQEFFTHDQLVALLAEATAVVCHGGPGTIMDAREAGHVPLCVARDPRLGEHVDDHQQRFAAMVGQAGVVHAVATLDDFHDRLDRVLTRVPAAGATDTMATRVRDTARARLAAELDELIAVRPPRLARRHRASL